MNLKVVEVKDLTVQFGQFKAVDQVSFDVRSGEIFGFLGANGAGKTTTIKVLCGLLVPSSGEVFVNNINLSKDAALIKEHVGYMSQKFTLYDDLTVEENLLFASRLRKMSIQYLQKRKDELFEMIGFSRSEKTLVRELPGGIKQQVSLVASMIHDPSLIFLDEPTAGVTPVYRQKFWSLIKKLAANGKTIFVTTHYMDEAEQCQRIALMRSGQLIALNGPVSLKRESFPRGLFELDPLDGSSNSDLVQKLRDSNALSFLEAYGYRYHIEVADENVWEELEPLVKSKFAVRKIDPSLEDVFISLVEGPLR